MSALAQTMFKLPTSQRWRMVSAGMHVIRNYSRKANNKDYYDILDITPKATSSEIKASYYRLSKKYHPDLNKDTNAAKQFAEISVAYQTLINNERRAIYDKTKGVQKDKANEEILATLSGIMIVGYVILRIFFKK